MDTGDGQQTEYIDLLKSVLKEHQVTLDHIVVTHWHNDHVGGVEVIKETISKGLFIFLCPYVSIISFEHILHHLQIAKSPNSPSKNIPPTLKLWPMVR